MMKQDQERVTLLDEYEHDAGMDERPAPPVARRVLMFKQPSINLLVPLALATSIFFNVLFLLCPTSISRIHVKQPGPEGTKYAGLKWDVSDTFVYGGLYDSDNETLTNQAWDDITFDRGSIALTDEYAESVGLPLAQRFPWDESKGLYFINAYHGVHCLQSLRNGYRELLDGRPLSIPFGHLNHCFEALLQDIKCFADDTPRFTALDHPGKSGIGQARQCRDWSKLEEFSDQHYSCWKDIQPHDKDFNTLLRYRYCPEGSPYNEWIHGIWADLEDEEI